MATAPPSRSSLTIADMVMLWLGIVIWLVTFLFGTLVDSRPYREAFSVLAGGFTGTLVNGLVVIGTYTLTNVAILCLIAGLLGALGARASLGTDAELADSAQDTTSPRNSALLRAFLVYLSLIAGVLIFGDDPAAPTQRQYVRLAGFTSLLSFVINYHPSLFGKLLQRVGTVIEGKKDP
ncbi:hypothetical protein [Nannocystis sp.]|uniref:hypothetical protein n=2 Tax=Nannocystis sp. TaxID=1962667 RepID=UPI0025CF07CE|nr:hypothetical protein [Nannocystis sp.]MBK7826937.1 hypothetical protein [Nannocystis sp.]